MRLKICTDINFIAKKDEHKQDLSQGQDSSPDRALPIT